MGGWPDVWGGGDCRSYRCIRLSQFAAVTKCGTNHMTNDALPTYLQDHLAGALHAIELLKSMRDHFAGEPLGTFATEVLAQVEADRNVLARIAASILLHLMARPNMTPHFSF
jgi:hypothetical protein